MVDVPNSMKYIECRLLPTVGVVSNYLIFIFLEN